MKYFLKCCVLILAVTVGAVALRIPQLHNRPMHCDEAVHAYKLGRLIEENHYRYDPWDCHGPTLNYFSLVPAWLSSIHTYIDLNEFTVRIVPVFFGVLLILLLLLLADALKIPVLLCAAVLTAVSPAFVFYSRYYVQEMLLVCFTFGLIAAGYRYTKSRNLFWAMLVGVFIGLMHATKETCIIAFLSILIALFLTFLTVPEYSRLRSNFFKLIKPAHLIIAFAVAVFISVLFYSSFFTYSRGVLDSILTYSTYFNRAGSDSLHIHPWYYYFKILLWPRYTAGPVFSEAFIVLLAVIGLVFVIHGKFIRGIDANLVRFITFYTVIMTAFYSAIPYKTPWCLLGFFNGMILLAAFGTVSLLNVASKISTKSVIIIFFLAGCLHLTWQSYLANYKYYSDPRNPYIYAHPTMDIFDITERVEEIAHIHPDGFAMRVDVICTNDDYWPLPWYLRKFTNIAYLNFISRDIPSAEVIIASPDIQPPLMEKLYETLPPGEVNLYVPLFETSTKPFRPGVDIIGLVTKDLWDKCRQSKENLKTTVDK
ncbi:MAG: flippase activity-associated protein Agl23 [Planctomycetota bacterium]|jgi:uncharacterized protein (TIGR03663 family)